MNIDNEEYNSIRKHLIEGQRLIAVRLFRNLTGSDLWQAKAYIDRIEATLRQECPELFTTPNPAEVPAGEKDDVGVVELELYDDLMPASLPSFLKFREEIEMYPRQCGYYIIDMAGISRLVERGLTNEEVLDVVFQYFDDQPWPPPEQRPSDQTWENDYQVDGRKAREEFIQAMTGGVEIGHMECTMPRCQAESFWDQFEEFFGEGRKYYTHLGLGNREYVFQHGVAIADREKVGIVWIVESD